MRSQCIGQGFKSPMLHHELTEEKIMLNDKIINRAFEIQNSGLKPFDSLHVASAEYSKADIFLTTDKNLLHAAERLKPDIITANPLNWFMEVDENE